MIHFLRLIVRAPIALAWTLLVHYFGIRLPQLFYPKRRCYRALSLWGRGLAAIMGVRIHQYNQREGPMGDVIIANHMGFLDVPVLLTFFPAVFMIKIEASRVFYFGKALLKQEHLFVNRKDAASRRAAGQALVDLLEEGGRVIIFPEGRASPGAERLPFKPFSFVAAQRLGKRVEACVIDYLPDRELLKWDVNRPMFPQLVALFGRRRTDVSIEFFPAAPVRGEPDTVAEQYRQMIQSKLESANDR